MKKILCGLSLVAMLGMTCGALADTNVGTNADLALATIVSMTGGSAVKTPADTTAAFSVYGKQSITNLRGNKQSGVNVVPVDVELVAKPRGYLVPRQISFSE